MGKSVEFRSTFLHEILYSENVDSVGARLLPLSRGQAEYEITYISLVCCVLLMMKKEVGRLCCENIFHAFIM